MDRVIRYPGHDLLCGPIVRAANCELFDADGRRWVDLEGGVWSLSLGHGHPRVLAALAAQAGNLMHVGFNYTHAVVDDAVGLLLERLGLGGGRGVLLCSGSEAVEFAARAARELTGRTLLLTMADSYLSALGSANRKLPGEWLGFDWTPCAACERAEACAADCDRLAALPFGQIGALVFEPGSAGGLVRFPPRGLVRELAARVKRAGGLVVVNEVTTGLGRTGTWFGCEHYGLEPDLVAVGKGLGSGYPVSAVAFAPAAATQLAAQPLRYAQSHQNDPLGAAEAREVLRTIADEDLVERGRAVGAELAAGLADVSVRTGRIREVRARGLMIAIELEGDASFAADVHRELARRGYLVGLRVGVPVLRLDPSLTIERRDVEGFLAALAETLGGSH